MKDALLAIREDLWVFIVSVSKGWENYRHESDALRQYQMFKERGISDDRIVLAIQDDLASHAVNDEAGVIRNQADGPSLYSEIEIDYRLTDVSLEMIQAVLSGVPTEPFPTVIDGNGIPDSVDASYYMYSDETGEALVSITREMEGDNCGDGGWRIDLGTALGGSA